MAHDWPNGQRCEVAVLVLEGRVFFPGEVSAIETDGAVGRLARELILRGQPVAIFCRRERAVGRLGPIHRVGTLAQLRVAEQLDGHTRVVAEGLFRVEAVALRQEVPTPRALVRRLPDARIPWDAQDSGRLAALARRLPGARDPEQLLLAAAHSLPTAIQRQDVLELDDPHEQLAYLCEALSVAARHLALVPEQPAAMAARMP